MAIVDELITLLGFEEKAGSASKAKKFNESITKMANKAKIAAAAITAVTASVGAFAQAMTKSIDESLKFSKSVGISVEELQELNFAAQQSGASVNAIRSILENTAQFGIKGAAGIESLAEQFKGLDAQTALLRGKAFGFGEDEIRLLRQGRDGIRAFRAEARKRGTIITEEEAERAAKFQRSLKGVAATIAGIGRKAVIDALPALQKLNESFDKWILTNRKLIQQNLATFISGVSDGMGKFSAVMTKVKNKIKEFLGPVGDMVTDLDKVDIISGIVTGGLVIMTAVVAILGAKFAIAAAAIGLAALVIEDFISFINGGPSAIGDFLAVFEEKLPGVFGLLKTMVNMVKDGLIPAFELLKDITKPIFATIKFAIDGLISGIKLLDDALTGLGFGVEDVENKKSLIEKRAQLKEQLQEEGGIKTARGRSLLKELQKVNLDLQEFGGAREVERQLANVGDGANLPSGAQQVLAAVPPAIAAQAARPRAQGGNNTIIVNGAGDPGVVADKIIDRAGLQNAQQLIAPGIGTSVMQ